MNSEELRRSHRYADFLPISITVRKNDDNSLIAGPLSARIVDVSNHGACLLMTQVMVHSYHIFHSTREDDSAALVLQIKLPSQTDTIEILSEPVWLNATKLNNDIKVFKMGVDFTQKIDTHLMRKINRQILPA